RGAPQGVGGPGAGGGLAHHAREARPAEGPRPRGALPDAARKGRRRRRPRVRDETVSRSYAETLFELALRNDAVAAYGDALEMVARLLDEDPKFRTFLETPRIEDEERK